MAQKILALINLQLPAGQATPAPPVTSFRSTWCQYYGICEGI